MEFLSESEPQLASTATRLRPCALARKSASSAVANRMRESTLRGSAVDAAPMLTVIGPRLNWRCSMGAAQRFAELRCFVRARSGQQHRELLATVAADEVMPPHAFLQCARDDLQHFVAFRVAEAIVELLEVVDVDHEQAQRPFAALRAREFDFEALVNEAAVRELGQLVGDTFALQLVDAAR